MNTVKHLFYLCIISTALLSCKKDVSGCTDSTSDTYNSEANVDNGTCSYHGFLTNWYDTTTRDSLVANNVAALTIYVDNEVVQNINPNIIIWSAQPDCSTTSIGNWITMEGTKSRTISISVKAFDATNTEIRSWNQALTINAGECELYQVIW
ncbi:MAG: hypothetical protein E6Q38_01780 [Crocinitomicaceae bacterium]|nr:MAG: hypothetical protein E6Q38_01780 [Crocinitomicaceae bacterium]